jgi:crossover junction endodeoxyribonuclease RusA
LEDVAVTNLLLFDGYLSWPPSVNHYWCQGKPIYKNGRRIVPRYKSDKANLFIKQTKATIGTVKESEKRICVEIYAFPPDKQCRDIDNILKAIFDALVCAKLIKDDEQIDDIRVIRGDVVKGGMIKIKVGEL